MIEMTLLKVNTDLPLKIGFASHQNAVAVLHELTLENPGDEPLRNLTVKLSTEPTFLETKIWKIDVIEPGTSIRVSDRNVKLEGASSISC